jgi:hypothetical protein
MKIPPFNASRHDDSNDMCFEFLWSLDGEILKFNNHFLELPGYFWQVSVLVRRNFLICPENVVKCPGK